MVKEKKNGGSVPVSRAECSAQMEPMVLSVGRIEKALIGDDLQGGLVKKFASLDNKLENVLKAHEEEKKDLNARVSYSRRMKITIISTLIGLICSLIYLAVDFTLKHINL